MKPSLFLVKVSVDFIWGHDPTEESDGTQQWVLCALAHITPQSYVPHSQNKALRCLCLHLLVC